MPNQKSQRRPELIIGFDSGTSELKVLYLIRQRSAGTVKFLAIDPDYALVPAADREAVLTRSSQRWDLGTLKPEDNAWVQQDPEGDCHVVGALARFFSTGVNMEDAKAYSVLYKILAAVGAIASRENLPDELRVDLIVVLPFAEYKKSGELLERDLRATSGGLSNFWFRQRNLKVELERFKCLPEGGGVSMLHLDRIGVAEFQQRAFAILMFGHRNTSAILMNQGDPAQSESTLLGFYNFLDRLIDYGNNLGRERIMLAIKSGQGCLEIVGDELVSARSPNREREIEEIVRAIELAKNEYWRLLQDWLSKTLPPISRLDKVFISGGAANFYRKEIQEYFAPFQVDWLDEVAETLSEELKLKEREKRDYSYRFVDLWGAFIKFAGAAWMAEKQKEKKRQESREKKKQLYLVEKEREYRDMYQRLQFQSDSLRDPWQWTENVRNQLGEKWERENPNGK